MVAPSVRAAFREEIRYKLPRDARNDATLDGDHVFWFESLPSRGWRFTWDGNPGQPFVDLVLAPTGEMVTWSRDGRRVAYSGRRGDRFFVGVDGRELGDYEGLARSVPPTFSPDGAHVAFGALVGGRVQLVLDNAVLPGGEIAPGPPVFSPDGRRIAYVEMETQPRPRQRLMVDGEAGAWFDSIGDTHQAVRFSPDSARLAYAAFGRDGCRVLVDGLEHPPFANVDWLAFSPDSQHITYSGIQKDGMSLVLDGRPGPRLKTAARPLWSPDGRRLAYVAARADHRAAVVLDDRPGMEFEDVVWDSLVFSPDGARLAYLAKRKGSGFLGGLRAKVVAVVDERVVGEYEDAGMPVFSPDGRRVAFRGRTGASSIVVADGEPGPPYDSVGEPRFGDGRLAHVAEQAKRRTVVVDGEPLLWVEEILVPWPDRPLMFSVDGDHVAWVAKTKAGVHPVVDGQLGAAYDGVSHPFLDPAGVFGFWTVRGTEVYRVQAEI